MTTRHPDAFPLTRHSVVRAIASADPEARAHAYDAIVRSYWRPVYAYIRVRWRRDPRVLCDGRRVPHDIAEEIGRGGMGMVFRGRDRELAREVAIKVTRWPGDDVERLRDEARVLAVDHPGIVPVHDAVRLPDGRAYYVMALVRGERFDAHAARLTRADRLRLFDRVCDTVAFAHARGIVHRDLKPANIMVGPFGDMGVLDWGLARLGSDPGRPVTHIAELRGTWRRSRRAGRPTSEPMCTRWARYSVGSSSHRQAARCVLSPRSWRVPRQTTPPADTLRSRRWPPTCDGSSTATPSIVFGLAVGIALAACVSLMQKLAGQPPYYWQIMLPGGILGMIVGYSTFTYRAASPRMTRTAQS